MRLVRPVLAALVIVGLVVAPLRPVAAAPSAVGSLPPAWSSSLQLGMSSAPGDASAMRATAPFALRSQYLSGGINTGGGWATWNAGGAFVSSYAQESTGAGMRSVFDYYMLLQSLPASGASEAAKISSNLNNVVTMAAYYTDLKLFFAKAAPFGSSVVLHVEPDLWGYVEEAATNNDATTVPAKVASSGLTDLVGLPDTAAGLAQAIVRLRDRFAPGVQLAYHVSVWGTGDDILYSKPADVTVDALAARSAAFYGSLGATFDLAFADPSDRDAAFKQVQYGDGGAAWWSAADYARNVRFIAGFSNATGKRIVLWQTPLGNTQMRAMNNTWDHYQDNHVEWFLDDGTRAHLSSYAAAGECIAGAHPAYLSELATPMDLPARASARAMVTAWRSCASRRSASRALEVCACLTCWLSQAVSDRVSSLS